MKRWLARILICLALGVVTTVGVAWTVGGSMDWRRALYYIDDIEAAVAEGRLWWESDVRLGSASEGPCWGAISVADLVLHPDPPSDSTEEAGEPPFWHMSGRSTNDYSEYAFGWPRLALRCAVYEPIVTPGAAPLLEFEPEGMIVLKRLTWTNPGWTLVRPQRFFPLEIIFPGFLIDTLIYGALWFGLFFGLGAMKRTLRRRRGRCPMCEYDLRGCDEPGCPECGWGRSGNES